MTSPELEKWGRGRESFLLSSRPSLHPLNSLEWRAQWLVTRYLIWISQQLLEKWHCWYFITVYSWISSVITDGQNNRSYHKTIKVLSEWRDPGVPRGIWPVLDEMRQDELHWKNPLCIEIWRPGHQSRHKWVSHFTLYSCVLNLNWCYTASCFHVCYECSEYKSQD